MTRLIPDGKYSEYFESIGVVVDGTATVEPSGPPSLASSDATSAEVKRRLARNYRLRPERSLFGRIYDWIDYKWDRFCSRCELLFYSVCEFIAVCFKRLCWTVFYGTMAYVVFVLGKQVVEKCLLVVVALLFLSGNTIAGDSSTAGANFEFSLDSLATTPLSFGGPNAVLPKPVLRKSSVPFLLPQTQFGLPFSHRLVGVMLAGIVILLALQLHVLQGVRTELWSVASASRDIRPPNFTAPMNGSPRTDVKKEAGLRMINLVSENTHSHSQVRASTNTGQVRKRNEDFVGTFVNDAFTCVVVADGCGGVPFGDDASQSAVEAGVQSLSRNLNPGSDIHHAIALALKAAELRLAEVAARLNINDGTNALRTTLIVAVASEDKFFWAYIGDGFIELVHGTGDHHSLLDVHRENEAVQNVLSASLGPVTVGEPEFGETNREPGDYLFVASDGVSDRVVPADFCKCCIQRFGAGGDLTESLDGILNELASHQDGSGEFVFSDNLTLGVIAPFEVSVPGVSSPAQPETVNA